jgi:hypothetical protein
MAVHADTWEGQILAHRYRYRLNSPEAKLFVESFRYHA